MIRIAINGFGRIGRCSFKQFLDDDRFEVVGINDLSDLEELAYLLKYDSVHGWYPRKVSTEGDTLIVDGNKIPFHQQRNPADLPWDDRGVDVVVESSGAMRSREDAAGHLEAGAKRVVISAPSGTADATFVRGVTTDNYDPETHIALSHPSA